MSMEHYNLNDGNSSIGEALQTNWVPLSLIGVGIAWLIASNTGGKFPRCRSAACEQSSTARRSDRPYSRQTIDRFISTAAF